MIFEVWELLPSYTRMASESYPDSEQYVQAHVMQTNTNNHRAIKSYFNGIISLYDIQTTNNC